MSGEGTGRGGGVRARHGTGCSVPFATHAPRARAQPFVTPACDQRAAVWGGRQERRGLGGLALGRTALEELAALKGRGLAAVYNLLPL